MWSSHLTFSSRDLDPSGSSAEPGHLTGGTREATAQPEVPRSGCARRAEDEVHRVQGGMMFVCSREGGEEEGALCNSLMSLPA